MAEDLEQILLLTIINLICNTKVTRRNLEWVLDEDVIGTSVQIFLVRTRTIDEKTI